MDRERDISALRAAFAALAGGASTEQRAALAASFGLELPLIAVAFLSNREIVAMTEAAIAERSAQQEASAAAPDTPAPAPEPAPEPAPAAPDAPETAVETAAPASAAGDAELFEMVAHFGRIALVADRTAQAGTLKEMLGAVGDAFDGLLRDLAPRALAERRRAVAEAMPHALSRITLALSAAADASCSDDERDAGGVYTERVGRAVLERLVGRFDEVFADGPVMLRRWAAALTPHTLALLDTVVEPEICAWLRERGAADLAAVEAARGDLPRAQYEALSAHLAHLAAGRLPGCWRYESERDVPQMHVSVAQLLDPAEENTVRGLSETARAFLLAEARARLAADAAGSAPLAKAERKHLARIAAGALPWGFVNAVAPTPTPTPTP